jgi:beta-galactosidase
MRRPLKASPRRVRRSPVVVASLPAIPPTFALGVCDYPEHVPWEQWKEYPARQRQMGLTYVRIAEFAWSKTEPVEGIFEWQWLDDAVEALHAEALKVVIPFSRNAAV